MDKAELQARINELENRRFMINMADRLSWSEKETILQIDEEIRTLKAQLEA